MDEKTVPLPAMDTTRQQKYSRLIQKEIGEIFQRDGYNFFGKAFVTVTGARVSPDLSVATIHLSMFGVKDPQALLQQITTHTKEIRKLLGKSIRHQARIIPELRFFIDDSLDQVERIEQLLRDSRIKKDGENG